MAKPKGAKRGPKEGSAKPYKYPLAPGFPDRLRKAMGRRSLIENGQTRNAALGEEIGCTGAVIGQYLNGRNDTVDLVLFLRMCDALHLTPYYLALDQGTIDDVSLDKIPMQEFRRVKQP